MIHCQAVLSVSNVTNSETPESPGDRRAPKCICGDKKGIRTLATNDDSLD